MSEELIKRLKDREAFVLGGPAVWARWIEEAATALTEAASENERLNAALTYEQDRSGRIGTHGVGCWAWGPRHYECAMARLKELEDIEDAALEIIGDAQEVEGSEGLSIVASLLIARARQLIQTGDQS